VEFTTSVALQAAIAAGPIDIGDAKITVEERRKSGKFGDGSRTGKLTGDGRIRNKSEDGRGASSKKGGRGIAGSGVSKPRAD
jgi:hypothetical protein